MTQMTIERNRVGRLVLVVGPSGAGKDTLIDAARVAFAGHDWIAFPRRVVTRPEGSGGEDHIAATPEAFADLRASGAFCLAWGAHGLAYGVPTAALDEVRRGRVVVLNVSRTMIGEAERLGVPVTVLHVTARPETLASRLAGRGRESAEAVAERLRREARLDCGGCPLVEVSNDGSVADGCRTMIAALEALRPSADAATRCESGRPAALA
jgi:ribose 1,5-bisphosphokinase